MKKKICILTATRAEYGLLKPVILKLLAVSEFEVHVVATGMHLSPEFGLTYKEIENDGIIIDEKIEILLSADSPSAISKSMGLAMMGFADYFARLKPDLLLVLGDRYETLAVCCAAMNERIPIAHMYGGETTEGAIDECIRHAITKMSYLHFTSTEEYRLRVIQLGEHPDRVFCVGATGVENALNEKLLSREGLEATIGFSLDKPYAVTTFHPVTLEGEDGISQIEQVLQACQNHQEINFIFTMANADAHGRAINNMIKKYVSDHANAVAVDSLGMVRYLSAIKYCVFVMGNSSSGLLEAPSFGVPTINIGDRQKGRLQAASVINCPPSYLDINKAIKTALSNEFRDTAWHAINPYGDGRTSDRIVRTIINVLGTGQINLKKEFYDIRGTQT